MPEVQATIRELFGDGVTLEDLAGDFASANGKAATRAWLDCNGVSKDQQDSILSLVQQDSTGLDDMRTMFAVVGTAELARTDSDLAYLAKEIADGGGDVDQCRQQLSANGDWWSKWLLTHLQPAQRQQFQAAVDDLRTRHHDDRLWRTVLPKWPRWRPRRRRHD